MHRARVRPRLKALPSWHSLPRSCLGAWRSRPAGTCCESSSRRQYGQVRPDAEGSRFPRSKRIAGHSEGGVARPSVSRE
jgi:hypothetical protein